MQSSDISVCTGVAEVVVGQSRFEVQMLVCLQYKLEG